MSESCPLLSMINMCPTDPKLTLQNHQLAASCPVDFEFVVAVIWLTLVLTLDVVGTSTYAESFPTVPTLGLHLAIGSLSHISEPHAGEKFQVKVKTTF